MTSIGGQVSWTTFSDGRYKKNIKQDVKGLSFINSLRPVTYTIDITSLDEYYHKGRKQADTQKKMEDRRQASADEASKIVYNGFIAQEVEASAQKVNYDFSGVDKPKTKDGLYGLRYSDFVVPLVKAVQELSQQNDELKKHYEEEIDNLQKQIDELRSLNVSTQSTVNSKQSTVFSSAALQQNIPNPFTQTTTISYSLPQKFSSAKMIVTDKNGKVLKQVNLSGSGKGTLNMDASILSAGAYQYSLYVDGRLVDSKQMEHIK